MSGKYSFLEGDGQVGELIRNIDWSKTSIGDPGSWPDSLTSAVSIVLNSGFPIAIYWGSDFSLIYNEPWSTIPGDKHPWALGKPGPAVWPEIWNGLRDEFETVLHEGKSYRRPDAPLYMHRYGYTEECYFDYTLSPVKARDGSVGGVFNAVIETTFRVINDRRNVVLASLIDHKNDSSSIVEANGLIRDLLLTAKEDIPFFALYSCIEDENMDMVCWGGFSEEHALIAAHLDIRDLYSQAEGYLGDVQQIFRQPIHRHWPEPVQEALIVPVVRGDSKIKGYLMLGVSARKRLDTDYRNFLQTAGMHVGTVLNNALSYEIGKAYQAEQVLNEELSAANEELAATNEELQHTQDQLHALNQELEDRVRRRTEQLADERDKLKRFFMQAPAGICILSGEDLVFELVNPAYQELLPGRELLGRPIFEALPEIKGQPVEQILQGVYTTGEPYEGKELYIPIAVPGSAALEDRYFNFYYQPKRDEHGIVDGIMAFVFEVTQLVESRKLSEKNARDLRDLVMTSHYPLLILRGRDYVVEVTNEQLAALWNKSLEDILGRKLLDILPELAYQPFPALLKQVYNTGIPYGQEEEVFYVETENGREVKYISFYYDPLKDADGRVNGIVVTAADITHLVRSRLLLEESYEQQQSLNEEITATNEELAAANEELLATNDELHFTHTNLEESLSNLAQSEARFRSLIQDAPVAIAVLRTRDLVIEAANTAILNVWGKTSGVIGMRLPDALPELQNQAYLKLLDEVYTSGKTYKGDESRAFLEHDGKLEELFFNFVYQPLFDQRGITNGIMVAAIDVTPQVKARRELENAQDSLKLAFEAAELGNFDLDLEEGTMFWDARCRKLFGISHDREVTYEHDFVNGLHPDDRERITGIINNAFIKSVSNGEYDVEYRTIGAEDNKLRWVRAKGKVYFDEWDKPVRFAGAVLDITEQKLDEIRKNDFIGMVSHELKTPLTSLSAYAQVLLSKAKDDAFSVQALTKVNQQVKRMSAMINSFLNVSRLESGKIQLVKQDFFINDLIDEIIKETQLITNSHEIKFNAPERIHVHADQDKIGSVITNLVSNAIKYSPRGHMVELTCKAMEDMVHVAVRDEGIGIKQEDQKKLFERYYRVENLHAKHISGFGIGLYLSGEIIRRHGGRIGVESEADKGSTFWFTLPLHS
ncbi:PAS domain-containing protein [Pararcticibacter amylolyticus]|uniref:histidine kinase n=1 Tax=Pararcticibacter amylolyticus TaxID=2173175 RepID=A0A2U2PAM6_9SPHI|nr:PAS domain-containing protein [Pararcticibacter amylolyticus]PWG78354.1 hypothetical protein DDR33_22570 [Pararcticibacter amylolyticus]